MTYNLKIIADCVADFAREDVLLVVEILTYQVDGEDAADYARQVPRPHRRLRPKMALDYGAKVLKLPYPGTEAACVRDFGPGRRGALGGAFGRCGP